MAQKATDGEDNSGGFAPKKVFVDNDFDEGEIFCRRLLECGEFNTAILKKFVPRGQKGGTNVELAEAVASDVWQDEAKAKQLMAAYCEQKRKWLHFRLGTLKKIHEAKPALDFLTKFGEAAWYGPFHDAAEDHAFYVRARRVNHFEMNADGVTRRTYKLRWHVVARLAIDHVSFHWDGFALNDNDERPTAPANSFPFWKYIPSFIDDLEGLVDADWALPELGPIILDDVWDDYRDKTEFRWIDKRIRAERHGVAIGAHSSAASEIDITGIQAFAATLARSALTSIGDTSPDHLELAQASILRTMIKEFGPKSYELKIDRRGEKDSDPFSSIDELEEEEETVPADDRLLRAHCYFGGKPAESGQDGFQHLNCWSNYGGSYGALRFLLPYALRRASP